MWLWDGVTREAIMAREDLSWGLQISAQPLNHQLSSHLLARLLACLFQASPTSFFSSRSIIRVAGSHLGNQV